MIIPIKHIQKIVNYMYEDELKHYQEWNEIEKIDLNKLDKSHIFYNINEVDKWLSKERKKK